MMKVSDCFTETELGENETVKPEYRRHQRAVKMQRTSRTKKYKLQINKIKTIINDNKESEIKDFQGREACSGCH